MKRFATTVTMLLVLATAAQAVSLVSWPMRELALSSETVVLAVPAAPGQFRTIRVFLGRALKEGDVFEIDDLSSYDLTVPTAEGSPRGKPVKVAEALLFLGPKKGDAPVPRFPLTPTGMRIAAADDRVYYPRPGEEGADRNRYLLRDYRPGVRWDDLVRRVAEDAAEVSGIRAIKAIDDRHRRDLALLDWVERRRREFGGRWWMEDDDEPSAGWGTLEQEIFLWVFESRIPVDCWAAVKLYAELNQGSIPQLQTPAFGTRAGRDLLLTLALDEQALLGHRTRAVKLLRLSSTLWPLKTEGLPAVEPLDEKAQTAFINRLTPLLKGPDPGLRAEAAGAILEASAPKAEEMKSLRTQRALAALTAAYRNQTPGPTRNALAQAVGGVGGADQWQELTGNPNGLIATLEDPGPQQAAEAYCWLVVRHTQEGVDDAQTLLLERLDNEQGVAEKKEATLDSKTWPANSGPTYKGATDPSAVYWRFLTFSMKDLTPGLWRMTVKGVAGKDKSPWTSEPRLLRLAPPPQPGQPNANPAAPRITFDP